MARDRRRAKQRQRRRGGDRQSTRVAARRESQRAPEPLQDASAEVELAEAAIVDPPAAELAANELSEVDAGEPSVAAPPPTLEDGDGAARAEPRPGETPRGELPTEGNRFVNFLRACAAELRRVQWPDRRQVTQATGVVIGFVIIAGAYLGVLDAIFSRLVNFIL
ncbi:MAG: preprotein translocase subunit SecE [Solirubrobacteraceae bacterium]